MGKFSSENKLVWASQYTEVALSRSDLSLTLSACSKQREEINREVDIAFNRIGKEIGKIKMKHRNIIQKHLDEIKQLQSPILQRLYALNEVEESKEVSATISYSCENETFSKQPPKRMYRCEISFQNKEIKKISSY